MMRYLCHKEIQSSGLKPQTSRKLPVAVFAVTDELLAEAACSLAAMHNLAVNTVSGCRGRQMKGCVL